jgi:hypothetical protein
LTTHPNGTTEETVWSGCCGTQSETDTAGVQTTYGGRDDFGRLLNKTRQQIDANHPALTTSYTYDLMNRTLSETLASGGASSGTSRTYHLAGRVLTSTDDADLDTSYAYDDDPNDGDGRKVTVTRPGEAPEVTEYYRDGQVKQVKRGTTVIRYNVPGYGDNPLLTRSYTGDDGADMYTETLVDALGRTVEEWRPGFDSTFVKTEYTYHGAGAPAGAMGKLKSTQVLAGPAPNNMTAITALTLHEYDSLGDLYRTGLDLGGTSGTLDTASTDRINETETKYLLEAGNWWQVTVSRVYATDNNGTPTPAIEDPPS